MKTIKSNLLTKIIIETGLLEYIEFTEKEKYNIRLVLNKIDKETDIFKNSELLKSNDVHKLLQVIKTLIVKSKRLDTVLFENQKITKELKQLKTMFQKEIANEKQVELNFEEGSIPINMINFSVRASNILEKLNINTINDLNKLTKKQLKSVENLGMKTLNEIIDKSFT